MLVFPSHRLYLSTEHRTGFRLTIGHRSVYLLLQALCWLFTLSCSASFNSALAERRNRFLPLLTLHTSLIPALNGCFAVICSLSLRCWYWDRAAALEVILWALCKSVAQQAHCFADSVVKSLDLTPWLFKLAQILNILTLLNISKISQNHCRCITLTVIDCKPELLFLSI